MINWDGYRAMCKEHNIDNPYENEEHYNRAYGIIKTVDLPLRITTKKQVVKKSLTTEKLPVDHNEEIKPKKPKPPTTTKPKSVKVPKPPKAKRPKKTPEELRRAKQERQRKWYRKTVGKEVRPQLIPRTSLAGMTIE